MRLKGQNIILLKNLLGDYICSKTESISQAFILDMDKAKKQIISEIIDLSDKTSFIEHYDRTIGKYVLDDPASVCDFGRAKTIEASVTSESTINFWGSYIECVNRAMKDRIGRIIIIDYYMVKLNLKICFIFIN